MLCVPRHGALSVLIRKADITVKPTLLKFPVDIPGIFYLLRHGTQIDIIQM